MIAPCLSRNFRGTRLRRRRPAQLQRASRQYARTAANATARPSPSLSSSLAADVITRPTQTHADAVARASRTVAGCSFAAVPAAFVIPEPVRSRVRSPRPHSRQVSRSAISTLQTFPHGLLDQRGPLPKIQPRSPQPVWLSIQHPQLRAASKPSAPHACRSNACLYPFPTGLISCRITIGALW